MRFLLSAQGATTGTLTSNTVDLTGYASLSGNALRLVLEVNNTPSSASWGAFALQSSSTPEFSSTTTHWSISDLDSPSEYDKTLYTCSTFVRFTADYVQPTDPAVTDAGGRVSVRGHLWGPPNWAKVVPCREEHILGMRSRLLDTAKGFPARWEREEESAKRHMETHLRGLGVDPYRLLTDGHLTYPCIEGLEHAGAALTVFYILMSSANVNSELRQDEMERFYGIFEDSLKTAVTSGALAIDADRSASVGDEPAPKSPRVIL